MTTRDEFKEILETLLDQYDVSVKVHIQDGHPLVVFFSPDFVLSNHQLYNPTLTCKFGNPSDKPDENCELFNNCSEHPKELT